MNHAPFVVRVIDSHTGGEPTRVVIEGGPDLGGGSVQSQLEVLRSRHDQFRSAVVQEPRGSDVLVGALLVRPLNPESAGGVIFFNNVGYLGMCGHGMIGLVVTLAYLGKLKPGLHSFETPVGTVTASLEQNGSVTIENVPSYRKASNVPVKLKNGKTVTGDVAWGGNWFYLVKDQDQELHLKNASELTDLTWEIRSAINVQGFPEVDHVELFGPPQSKGAQSRNFVLCPGKAYDRSPCGTGTSAKLACLAAEGKLGPGECWIQESIIGSTFQGSYRWLNRENGEITPTINGTAFVTAEAKLVLNPQDPFCWGIR